MASTKLYLDIRRIPGDSPAPLKIAIRDNKTTAYIPLGISIQPSQWDAVKLKVNNTHPMHKSINALMALKKSEIDMELMKLYNTGGLSKLTATQIKHLIVAALNPGSERSNAVAFIQCFKQFMELKSQSTRGVYLQTLSRLKLFCDIDKLKFEDITPNWLNKFDAFMANTAPSKNARNIHLRNIRAVFNFAIDNEMTSLYPFRKFKIRPETTRKRSLNVEDLRELFDYPVEAYAEFYRDMFKLIFMLIGINTIDLYRLQDITADNHIEYKRAKTGRLYSIRVEPEAKAIIDKYRGDKGLLSIADRWDDHRNFRKQINKALQLIGADKNKGGRLKGGMPKRTDVKAKGLWPELTTYWARHSWATIAASLDIPKETIAAALGHGGNTVTDIYISFDQRKIDEANRRVLDWVLYGKR